MLAYVFWHRPRAGVDTARYEAALVAFHRELAGEALDGVHGSATYASESGYEDWYFVEASFALDTLNTAAAGGRLAEFHSAVAALTGDMSAGLYRDVDGTWTRQMVLGPEPQLPRERPGRRLF
jgi:hypothetical protein